MAYQSVGAPRFYINVLEWLDSIGHIPVIEERFRTLPVVRRDYPRVHNYFPGSDPDHYDFSGMAADIGAGHRNFIALLGHEMTYGVYSLWFDDGVGGSYAVTTEGYNNVVNTTSFDNRLYSNYHGFSIATFDGSNDLVLSFNSLFNTGSVVIGTYYDMPHSPDLNLTLTREYGGIKTLETKGGASLSNTFYTKSPNWGNAPAWELYDGTIAYPELSRSGRRIWDLSFSYLDDGDVFGSNQLINQTVWGVQTAPPYEEDDIRNNDGGFEYNIISDYNFYSQVIHKTNGGQLPFIFQPDTNDNTQFAICKFDMKSFKFDQVANGVYSVKLKIREVW